MVRLETDAAGRGAKTVGEYPRVQTPDPKHNWDQKGLSREENVSLIEKVAKSGGKVKSSQLSNGGWSEQFESTVNGNVIHVEVYTPPGGGSPIISDAWVVR